MAVCASLCLAVIESRFEPNSPNFHISPTLEPPLGVANDKESHNGTASLLLSGGETFHVNRLIRVFAVLRLKDWLAGVSLCCSFSTDLFVSFSSANAFLLLLYLFSSLTGLSTCYLALVMSRN